MNILGVIAELNPLHTGHKHLFDKLRPETDAAFCVVVMSGDYVQRGEPAFFSKFLRTKAALLSGADLVLELPLSISTGSAGYFAAGAVSLLNSLGCVTHLGFGSESGDVDTFRLAGKLLSEEPENYRILLRKLLKAGMSFPRARYEALSAYADKQFFSSNEISSDQTFSKEKVNAVLSLLSTPNNMLGAEYCKALYSLRSSITPVPIKRVGAGYHDVIADEPLLQPEDTIGNSSLQPKYASASGLRKAFLASEQTDNLLYHYVPEVCRPLYQTALTDKQYVVYDDFFLPLYHMLQYADIEMLTRFQDVTPEFAGRLLHTFRQCSSVTELCAALKTKNLTAVRINRCLLHILLHLEKDAVQTQKERGYALYARILGFRREAQPLLSIIKRHTFIPLVAKPADAKKTLSPVAALQLEQTIKASELYRTVLPGVRNGSEYTQKVILA